MALLAVPARPLLLPALLLGALGASPARAQDCDDWGVISPDETTVYLGESRTVYISGGRECGDIDSCEWSVDDDLGQLSDTTGSPVDWVAPDELAECIPLELRLYALCTDGGTSSAATINLRCTDEQIEALRASRGSTVSGGGCGSPTSVAGLLLLPGLALLRRRR